MASNNEEESTMPTEESATSEVSLDNNDDNKNEEAIVNDNADDETATTRQTTTMTTATTTGSGDDEQEYMEQSESLQKLLHGTKVNGGKQSIWKMTLETFGMADGGKGKDDDIRTTDVEYGVRVLLDLVNEMIKQGDESYHFKLSPLDDFNATTTDLLRAFVHWSYKDESKTYNVSKAFRRLQAYVRWMEDHRQHLEQPLDDATKQEIHELWGPIRVTHSNTTKQLLWWVDVVNMDIPKIKKYPNHEKMMQYFVWISHWVILDDAAQQYGANIIQNMGYVGMMDALTMIPPELSTQLDRLTIGILPLKVKAFYMLQNPRWLSILTTLMKPFMSKKMRQRMILLNTRKKKQSKKQGSIGSIKDNEQQQPEEQPQQQQPDSKAAMMIDDVVGGKDAIPKDFGVDIIEGTLEVDELAKIIYS